jgi:isopenicillin N synthase-like dioxygenase
MSKRVDGKNRDYIRYDQVDKDQSYRLAEADAAEAFDDDYVIKTCDIGRFVHGTAADRRALADELGGALEDIGFAILEGHGIDPALHDRSAEQVFELFARTTVAERMRYRAQRHGSVNQGYFPIKETSDIHPDLVEGWVFCRRAFDRLEDFWPCLDIGEHFRGVVTAHEALILPIMQSLLLYLGADPHLYDARMTGTNIGLRLNYYPPISDADDASGAGRLLGHEDVTMFTLLPAPQIEGLQVLDRRTRKWIRLQAPRGTIILNTGDYMQRISNDILPSTTHRVSKPRDPELRRRPRASFPLNVYLWEDELIEVLPNLPDPKYPPVKAQTFHTRITSKYYGDAYAVE